MTEIQLKHWSESDQEAIRHQLDRILHSGPFHQSQRRQPNFNNSGQSSLTQHPGGLRRPLVPLSLVASAAPLIRTPHLPLDSPPHPAHRGHHDRAGAGADLRVLARNTTFQYKGKAVDVSKLGRELGVRYVLEGSVRRSGDDLRVTAQLIDAETGAHIWADKFDRKMADVFLVQDEIVGRIVAKIASGFGAIENTEAKSAARKSPEQIQAYDLVLRARDVMRWDYSRANFRSAEKSLRQAIALDPLNARARRELAWLAALGWVYRFDETPVPPHEILEQATKAVSSTPPSRARGWCSQAHTFSISSPIGSSMKRSRRLPLLPMTPRAWPSSDT